MSHRRLLLLILILSSTYSAGCATLSDQVKTLAIEAATRASTTAIEAGKVALADLGDRAESRVRSMGSDLYSAVKTEVEAGGSLAALKVGEVASQHLREAAPEPVVSLVEERVRAALVARGLLDETGARIGKPDDELSMFEQLLLGLAGVAGTVLTTAGVSHVRQNGRVSEDLAHRRKVAQKQYEAELLARAPS